MPDSQDPRRDAEQMAALVDALAREGLPRRAEAARAVQAVACALAQRLADPDFGRLRAMLPDPFRRPVPCERHATAPPGEIRSVQAFHAIVAEDIGIPPERAEPTVRAVFAALRSQLSDDEAEEIAGQLPHELQPLWRRPS